MQIVIVSILSDFSFFLFFTKDTNEKQDRCMLTVFNIHDTITLKRDAHFLIGTYVRRTGRQGNKLFLPNTHYRIE
jgi:hypothetical protein